MTQDLFDNLLEKAKSNPDFGSPSYVLRRGTKYQRLNREDGQLHFNGSLENAMRYRELEANELLGYYNRRGWTDISIEVIDTPHTRASNALWRLLTPYRVVQIRMEGEDKENPENNQFFGIAPSGRLIELTTKITEPGMTEVFWCDSQEVPWRLFAKVSEFQ